MDRANDQMIGPPGRRISRSGPVRMVRLLERLGPTFIKAGQYLALRPDLLPQEYCDELLNLVDRVPPYPWPRALAIMTEDLGRDPRELFDWINPNPVAAASLAQVYLARTKDGREVAVKVQRPDIRERVFRDLKRLRRLAPFLGILGLRPAFSIPEAIEELSRWFEEELDFVRELSNLDRLYRAGAQASFRVPAGAS